MTALLAPLATAAPALAANGSNLASFDAKVTAGIPSCGVGTGIAYDGTSLILSCWGSNVLQRVRAAAPHDNIGAKTITGLPNGNDIQALAWDGLRNKLWACNSHNKVVLVDMAANAVDVGQAPFSVPGCTDGLAYDGADDTIWVSPDVSNTIYHYNLSGGLIASFPLSGKTGNCGNSGIAVGGPKMYLANNGCSQIYETDKTFATSTLFASFPARLEDLECDGTTFAGLGVGAIWSQDAYDRILNAWEIPAGLCEAGGGARSIKLTPATATNLLGTTHTVTATVLDSQGLPFGSVPVSFAVTGANAGAVGTCSPPSCVTNASGQVSFTYTGTNLGADTITACFTNKAGVRVCTTVAKTWIKASPSISTTPSGSVPAGGNVSDAATVSGGSSPTGTVTFTLYGPGDTTCKTPIATRIATVAGNGTYGSGNVAVGGVGTYNWVAIYSGDTKNDSATSPCGSETVVVIKASPSISTTPSPSVPAGGIVSDSATVSGGFSPTGTVTFTLYAPGDTTCKTPIATRTATVAGNGTYGSGNVTVGAAGTYNWMAVYSGDTNNNAVTSPCGSEPVEITPQRLTGHAYGLAADATAVGGAVLVNVAPLPDTGYISTTASSTTSTPCVATLSGSVSANVLCANVTTVGFPGKSMASAAAADAKVAVPGISTITMRVVKSTSTTTCAGSSGTTTIDYLAVGGVVVINQTTVVAPNTTINVGVVKLVLNEQIAFSTPDKGLTVNAVHATVNTLGSAKVNVIVASSESDIGNCP